MPDTNRVFTGKGDYDDFMDPEVVDLCDAINSLPDLVTSESCSGHGKEPFKVFFKVVGELDGLFFLTRCVDRRYFEHAWSIQLSVSDLMHDGILPTVFILSSEAMGPKAYAQAKDLVENMTWHLNHPNFISGYGLDISRIDHAEYEEVSDA